MAILSPIQHKPMLNGRLSSTTPPTGNVARGRRLSSAHRLVIGMAVCLAIIGQRCCAAKAMSESQVKGAFLYNFAKFVEWPSRAFQDANSPIVIGVMGEKQYSDAVETIIKGKTVNGRRLACRRLDTQRDVDGCHIVFIATSERRRTNGVLERLKASPTLTVGETEGFIQSGGVIGFVVEDQKVGFEINAGAAKRKGLKISSQLLKLAKTVRD